MIPVLQCLTCNTFWDQQAIEEYNEGSVQKVVERHRRFWSVDPRKHIVVMHIDQ